MLSLELVSHVLLWIVVILQGIFLLALARQIGLLHEQLPARGARIMNVGLDIGELAPTVNVQDINNHRVTLGVERGKHTLLLFISTGCSICETLLPKLKILIHDERDNWETNLVAFGTTLEAGKKYAVEHGISEANIPFIISDNLALHYKVSLVPYGIVIDQAGIVRAKGLVNSHSDIDSLLNAEEMGVRSIQQFLEHQKETQPSSP